MVQADDLETIEAGAFALHFANTLDWHASDHPVETLFSYEDLVAWAVGKGILDAHQAATLRDQAKRSPKVAARAFAEALALRESIYDVFLAVTRGEGVSVSALERLNEGLRRAQGHLLLAKAGDRFDWQWESEADDLEMMLWPVVRSAASLLTSPHLDRVRQCADDRGCGYLFFDSTRNRSRRWCTMESCGNRAKARRHYERTKQDKTSP